MHLPNNRNFQWKYLNALEKPTKTLSQWPTHTILSGKVTAPLRHPSRLDFKHSYKQKHFRGTTLSGRSAMAGSVLSGYDDGWFQFLFCRATLLSFQRNLKGNYFTTSGYWETENWKSTNFKMGNWMILLSCQSRVWYGAFKLKVKYAFKFCVKLENEAERKAFLGNTFNCFCFSRWNGKQNLCANF